MSVAMEKGHNYETREGSHVTQTSAMMAMLRFRRKRVCLMLLIACLFWLVYLFMYLPAKGNPVEVHHPTSPSRVYFTAPLIRPPKVEPDKNVIDPPQAVDNDKPPQVLKNDKVLEPKAVVITASLKKSDPEIHDLININGSNTNGTKTLGGKKESEYKDGLDMGAIGNLIKDKGYELGLRLKNKTLEVGEKMKNKTLEQLAVIRGGNDKKLPQLVFVPMKWNLSVNFDDIGDLMKETQFLNKVDPLNLNGPILVSSRNRTANFTYTMPLKFGYCDCFERYCFCCSQISSKRLHLNSTACSNFTFLSKTQELDLQLSLDGKPIHRSSISADKSPLLCVGSVPKVADICVHFFNMTFKVNEHNAHQTQLLGCTDLSLNFYNRTIGAFPVDCFQIPGDPNQVHKERKFNMMFNWVP